MSPSPTSRFLPYSSLVFFPFLHLYLFFSSVTKIFVCLVPFSSLVSFCTVFLTFLLPFSLLIFFLLFPRRTFLTRLFYFSLRSVVPFLSDVLCLSAPFLLTDFLLTIYSVLLPFPYSPHLLPNFLSSPYVTSSFSLSLLHQFPSSYLFYLFDFPPFSSYISLSRLVATGHIADFFDYPTLEFCGGFLRPYPAPAGCPAPRVSYIQ